MREITRKVEEATRFIARHSTVSPSVAIVLGSGLGQLAKEVDVANAFDFGDIPNFRKPTATGHLGKLTIGRIRDVSVCAMSGRFHTYEGHSAHDVTLPVRVMHSLGAGTLVITNASGGLNPNFSVGDIMLIEDQINLLHRNPLVGVEMVSRSAGDRLKHAQENPSIHRPIYDERLMRLTLERARQKKMPLQTGVYCSVTGPNYETRAEIRMLRTIGADAVGMSTIPEVIVATSLGMRVLGLSAITNCCSPDARIKTTGEDVVVAAESTQPRMRDIVLSVLSDL